MKTNNINLSIIIPFLLLCIGLNGQNISNIWEDASIDDTAYIEKSYRNTTPQEFHLFSLNMATLKNDLEQAPERFTSQSNVIITLPTHNGELQKFRVYEASVLAPSLQALHPNIRSYTAQGIDDPSAIARFSLSSLGLNVMISSNNYKTLYIDPYTKNQDYYISYDKSSLTDDSRSIECLVQDTLPIDLQLAPENADDGMLRTFRLALACTGEYSQYHLTNQGVDPGATDAVKKAAVLSAMNTAMTRVNGVYEREVSLTMVIVPTNTDIIYLNAATDPYTNNDGLTMLGQNQTTCDAVIGSANYDIGHVFSTGGGGIASLQSPCNSGQKARGVTGLPSPIGDSFYIDFVAHEMGHQFGGNHTQNNDCQRNSPTAMEPGSASTIMGYAGICSPNVQNNSDDYFHAISIQEIWNFISAGSGQCSVQSATGNLPPTADAGPATLTIPLSTPFVLKGVASDPDTGNILSHNWEQMDPQVAVMPPSSTSVSGPLFRSELALASPDRYMPKITTVLAGQTESTWEVVPSVERPMSFRYTVRDNVAGGASSASDNIFIVVSGSAGPFVITSQATPTTWQTQTTETITWDVANTDIAPVDSPNVDILFSIDGGLTYPVIIAEGVPNSGSAVIDVPNLNTTTGRIMVISSNNIFYDLNGGVITVEGTILSANDFAFDNFAIWPNPSNGTFHIAFTPAPADDIEVSLYDIRGKLVSNNIFETNGSLFNQTLNYNSLDTGVYFIKVSNNGENQTVKLIIN